MSILIADTAGRRLMDEAQAVAVWVDRLQHELVRLHAAAHLLTWADADTPVDVDEHVAAIAAAYEAIPRRSLAALQASGRASSADDATASSTNRSTPAAVDAVALEDDEHWRHDWND